MATKARKQEIVSELHQFFENGKVAIVTDLSGLTVAEITRLRRQLDKNNAKCRIAKNTLVKIATNSKDFEAIKTLAKGPSAIIIGYDDPAQPAKTTVDFLKALKKGKVRGGVLDGKAMTSEEVKGLADLPSKDQLLSSIMAGLDSGARGIAGLLEAVIRDIAVLAEEVAKKNNPGGDAESTATESDKPQDEPAATTEAAAPAVAEAAPAETVAPPETPAPAPEEVAAPEAVAPPEATEPQAEA